MVDIPEHLRHLQDQLDAGVDADDISGIEELWIWRAERHSETWNESDREFIEMLKELVEKEHEEDNRSKTG